MIEQKTPDCALGLTTDTLSAWHDEDLRHDDMQRIREHITTCAACRQRLAGFELVARALGRQRELEPGDRVWQAVQSRIAAHAAGRSGPMRGPVRIPNGNWRGVAAVASVLLVVGLMAYVLSAGLSQRGGPPPTSTATAAPTPTVAPTPTLTSSAVVPGPQLSWQPAQGYPAQGYLAGVARPPAVAPGDGDLAYTFAPPSQGGTQAQSFVTHDAGAKWTAGGTIAVGSQPSTQPGAKPFELQGSIVVAANDPATAITSTVWLQAGASGDPSLFSNSVTFDSGAHWQAIPGHAIFSRLATYQGRIYAQRLAERAGGTIPVLYVSTDHMATWQSIDGNLPQVQAFWLNPSSGALLVDVYGAGTPGDLFYTSTNGGASWSKLPAPQLDQGSEQWIVQAPTGNAPWHICGVEGPTSPNGSGVGAQPATMTCSSDGGQTWVARSALNLVQNSPKGFQYFAPLDVFAIAGDSAVLATALGPSLHVFRLPAGATVWQDLGPQPDSNSPGPAYYPTSSGGVLWFSGANVFTATYPSA